MDKVEITYSYVYNGQLVDETISYSRKEVELEANQAHGAEHALDPKWRPLDKETFRHWAERKASVPYHLGYFGVPFNKDTKLDANDFWPNDTILLPLDALREVRIRELNTD